MVSYRYLGRSGLKITEITYGNWLTHGSQVENDTAKACVRAALDAGITTLRHRGRLRQHQGRDRPRRGPEGRAARSRSRSSPRSTGPPAPAAPTTRACRASTSSSRSTARSSGCRPTTSTCTRRTATTSRPRSRRRCRRSPTSSAPGKALYIGVSEWTADQIRAGHALAQDLGFQLISNQPQYSALWRVIEGEVVPTSAELGLSQIVWSPVAQGVLTGKYKPGEAPPAGSRATDDEGRRPHDRRGSWRSPTCCSGCRT